MIGIGLGSGGFEKKNPFQFSFGDVSNVNPSTTQFSSVTPTGYDGSVTVVVVAGGGSIRKNSTGSYGTSIVLFPNDVLNIQMGAASSYGTPITTTVMMGTISTTWTVTTSSISPGNQSYTVPGTYNFTVPNYNTINATVYGASGGSSSIWFHGGRNSVTGFWDGVPGSAGSSSSFGSESAGGGGGGTSPYNSSGTPGSNGVGSGGNIANDSNGPAGGVNSIPSKSGAGGSGGRSITSLNYPTFTPGSVITVVVGTHGVGGNNPTDTSGNAGTNGQDGSVVISWS